MLETNSQLRFPDLLKLLGIAALYALLSKLTLHYLAANGSISVIWPPSGLALAAVLIGGGRYVWSVFLGAFLLNITQPGISTLTAIGFATGPSLEVLLGSWLLTHNNQFKYDFLHQRDLIRLVVLAGFAGVVAGALIGTSTLLVSGLITPEAFLPNLLQWWMGDALGIILITPLILIWQRLPDDWFRPGRTFEVLLLFGLTVVIGQVIFMGWFRDVIGPYAHEFFMFLFVALAAVRLGIHGVPIVLTIVAIQGIWGINHGLGYFSTEPQSSQLVNYWLYIVTLSFVGIMLATYIAAEKRDKETLREQEEFFRMITDNIDDLIAVLDLEGRRLYNSPSYAKLFGDPEQLLHTNSFAEVHPDDRDFVKQVFRETVESGEGQRIEFRFVLADGSIRDMESRGGLIKNNKGEPLHVVVVSHDITERKKIDEKIRNLAFYDTLTQLPNRRMLNDRLAHAMAASKRSGRYGAVLFLDLDNFKPLNDEYGHNIGDILLIEVARRIKACVREVDTVARFGGDEFVVMLGALDSDREESLQQAYTVAEKIRRSLAEPYIITVKHEDEAEKVIEHHCTSSIGVVLFISNEASQEDIIKWADMAMYRAKEYGRNRISFHQ